MTVTLYDYNNRVVDSTLYEYYNVPLTSCNLYTTTWVYETPVKKEQPKCNCPLFNFFNKKKVKKESKPKTTTYIIYAI